MNRVGNLVGRVFGDRTVIGRAPNGTKGLARFLVRCSCGDETVIRGAELLAGRSLKCKLCAVTKHGQAKGRRTPEYIVWLEMIQRCHNPNNASFDGYGGRGIKVCDEWRTSFKAFFDYVGPRTTSKHSIDRYPDNDGNYEPGNVRWASRQEQEANKGRKDQAA